MNKTVYADIREIKKYALDNKVPIMQDDGIDFLTTFIVKNQINSVLEIGSAIGYSAIMMALANPKLKITTIERDKDRYLEKFCENQYAAFLVGKEVGSNKITEQYLNIQKDVFQIGKSDRGHDAFVTAMRQTIEPLYQIANNQGYGIWWYEENI